MNPNLTYSWRILSLSKKNVGDTTDVVCEVLWALLGHESEESVIDAQYGQFKTKTTLDIPETFDNNFISYENLTEQDVIGWIESKQKMSQVYDVIDKDIEKKRSHFQTVVGSANMPWNTNV